MLAPPSGAGAGAGAGTAAFRALPCPRVGAGLSPGLCQATQSKLIEGWQEVGPCFFGALAVVRWCCALASLRADRLH